MNWVTIIWSMIASACLTLAAMHLLVWCMRRTAWADLLFCLTAVATAGLAFCELWTMQAETPGQLATAVRWFHVPVWVIIVTLVGFVRIYLRAGRPWLAWTIYAVRSLSLLANFLVGQNLNFREVTRLRHIPFFGGSVSVAEGVANPWMLVGQLSLMLLVVFVADAAISVWRRGDLRQALLVGGSIVFFSLAGTLQAILVTWQIVHWPMTISFFFLAILLAMGYEMSCEALRATQLSAELRESEERMTLATEAVGLGAWMWHMASNRIWGTERWLCLFGFAPGAEIQFVQFMQRIHPDDREAVERELRRAVTDHADYAGEFRVVLPDSALRWVAIRGRVSPDPRGKPARMLGVAVDITRRRQSDLELAQHRDELAHLSRVTMLGELAGSLAHELNQPLTAILSNAQAAQRFLTQDVADIHEVCDILADIVAEDKRAGGIISRLRLLFKKGQVQQQPLDVNETVQEVLKLVRSDLINRGVAVRTALATDLPVLHGDRVQLQQVLLNLVMNACDAMAGAARDDRRILICTDLVGGDSVRLSVADRGVGVAAAMMEQIFAPFYTTKPQGLGMGLTVCRTIISAHGGKLWAVSNPPRGTTFHVTLPVGTNTKGVKSE